MTRHPTEAIWNYTEHSQYIASIFHYSDAIMNAVASQITGVSIVCFTVCLGTDQRKYQSSASLIFVRGIHRQPVNSAHTGPVTWKMFPLDDVIMSPQKIPQNTVQITHRTKIWSIFRASWTWPKFYTCRCAPRTSSCYNEPWYIGNLLMMVYDYS